ncbi:DUF7224 domain-containing protein [Streptomyces corynorhini]|uniref:DUF7224 domain-containing protein n=1 Tax=Streptomyces corynorhini TaxID=2282652 RepID=A0A370B375_9ACTN|nr:hypothetical protein [Streptomyces corynorhini]RDG36041.1 hypothetical protein DVH02_22150 [Streptomyces corynorhini]
MGLLSVPGRTAALWAAGPLTALNCWYVYVFAHSSATSYGGFTTHVTGSTLFATSAGCAALAAWAAGRLRAARIWSMAPVRGRLAIAGSALLPVAAVAVASTLAACATAALMVGAAPRLADLPTFGMLLSVVAAHLVLGFAAGSVLPRLIACPLMLVGVFLWMGVPATMEAAWVRHLNGLLVDSATVTDDIAPSALIAPVLLAGGAALAVLVVAAAPLRRRSLRAALGACCAVTGAAAAYALVAGADTRVPTVPRTGAAASVCDTAAPRVCVPEELRPEVPRLRAALDEVLPRMEAAGIRRPTSLAYVSDDVPLPAGAWRIAPAERLAPAEARAVVTLGPLPAWHDCPNLPEDGWRDEGPVAAWLGLAAGLPAAELAARTDPDSLRVARTVRGWSRERQRGWFADTTRLLDGCEPDTEGLLAGSAAGR